MNSFSIKTASNGEITIFKGSELAAQMIDLTDIGLGIVPHKLNTISELQAIEIIECSSYITIAERYMRALTSELEYQAQEEQKRIQEMENREESCPLCDTYHDDWYSCFSIREQY